MATEEQIQKLINGLYQIPPCERCGVKIRYGDLDCPRCGADIEDALRDWAEQLIDELKL
jgi:hypothetical protein